jgi:hypothetical protein
MSRRGPPGELGILRSIYSKWRIGNPSGTPYDPATGSGAVGAATQTVSEDRTRPANERLPANAGMKVG